ncbi:MAG: hypothetical protein IJU37_12630 [Desulfovibrio sp.]|nr:hypothetical protein [Desulfovibrio sp.]
MHHTITVNASLFAQALKDANTYTSKNVYDDATNHIVLNVIDKGARLAVVACDSHGYYERRIPLIKARGEAKPSLPGKEQRLCIAAQDALILHKRIPSRSIGCVTLQLDDKPAKEERLLVTMTLPDGASTSFFRRTDFEIPDFSRILKMAEKGKKNAPDLSNVFIPVHEMARVGKVLPTKGDSAARIYTAKGAGKGHMALLEYCEPDDDMDVRIIFMLSELAQAA